MIDYDLEKTQAENADNVEMAFRNLAFRLKLDRDDLKERLDVIVEMLRPRDSLSDYTENGKSWLMLRQQLTHYEKAKAIAEADGMTDIYAIVEGRE